MIKISYNTQKKQDFHDESVIVSQVQTTQKQMSNRLQIVDLEEIPLFKGLTPRERDWLRGRLYQRAFSAGAELMETGSPGEFVYIILSGTMKVYAPQPDGQNVIVAILGPGDPVGEMSAVDRVVRSANVIALEESMVLWMNQADFQDALNTVPRVSQNLLQILSTRLRTSTGQIQALASLDVNRRIARQLLSFAERYGRTGAHGEILIPIRLTQSDVAELVGASRKRVNQVFVLLKQQGWISIDAGYHITLLDPEALKDL